VPSAPLSPEVVEFLKKPNAAVMDFERLRLKHMRRDPRVALTVLDLDDWYHAVTVFGRVVEIREDEGLVDIDRLSQRYRGSPYWNRDRKRITALIECERWHEHS
jgi:nitroimidazol reductase NimA-like FMN-containing flavoprotein (pyridoxamine 5'-phosphate oxidase superfamily)